MNMGLRLNIIYIYIYIYIERERERERERVVGPSNFVYFNLILLRELMPSCLL